MTRYPGLMLMPVLLDAFLWLGPHLSAYPLFRAYLDFLQSPEMQAMLASNSPAQLEQLQILLDQSGQMFNLFWWLSPTLLGVPGLMVGVPANKLPNGIPATWQVSNVLVYVALFVVLSIAGLALSAIYWAMLASRVRGERLGLQRIAALWWGLCKVTLLVIVAALANAAVYRVGRPLRLLSREYRETRKLESQVTALRRENASLERRIKHLQTPQGAAVAARKLGYVKPGEVTLVLPDKPAEHTTKTPR